MAEKSYTRNQAAEILNVSISTISNYIENGLLTNCAPIKGDRRQEIRVKASEVEALRPHVTDIESLKQTIDEYKQMLRDEKENIIEDYKVLMDFSQSRRYFFYDMGHILECLFAIEDPLGDREKDVLVETLKGTPLSTIAKHHNLSRERIRQIIVKAKRKIDRRCMQNVADSYRKCFQENESLKKENKIIKKALDESSSHLNILMENNREPIIVDKKLARVLLSDMNSFGLSVRLYNVFKIADISTMADLVSYRRNEVMRFRNLGRKTLLEADMLLEKYGLEYGMDLTDYGFVKSLTGENRHMGWMPTKELIEALSEPQNII